MAARLRLAAALALILGAPASAQLPGGVFDTGVVQSDVLVISFERVFAETAYGARIAEEIEAESAALAAENRRIEADLTEEERALTDRRDAMPAAEFRALAEAFDTKVQQLRRQQDGKAQALTRRGEEAQRALVSAAQPVLQQIMREAGAAVILERRAVFIAADDIDVTDLAIARIDEALGDGAEPAE